MLDPPGPARKNSLGACLDEPRNAGRIPKVGQVPRARPGKKRQGHSHGELRIVEKRASNGRAEAPPGVGGDDLKRGHFDIPPGRGLDQVRLCQEAVVEGGGDDLGVGVESESQKRPPPDRTGEVNPFCQSHFGQSPQ